MNSEELKKRTKQFALDVIKLVGNFPKNRIGDVLGRQLLKSATSVGANYRSACRSQSHAHFVSKISIVEEEADESLYWLELAIESGLVNQETVKDLIKEANELTSIFTASRRTAKRKDE
jgi:four helix bundle protein